MSGELLDLELEDVDGNVRRLGDVAPGRPLVLVLVRYYGCMPCRDYLGQVEAARDEIERMGFGVVGIGVAADYQAKALMDGGIGYDLLLDAGRAIFDALSLGRFPWWRLTAPTTWLKYLRAAKGARQGRITGHPLQSPGLAVLDPTGESLFVHRGKTLGDYPSIERLLEVLGSLRPRAA